MAPLIAIATDKVLIPILPINILSINIILPGMESVCVIPVLSPTVPNADIASNKASLSEHFSKTSKPIVEIMTIAIAVMVRVKALYINLWGIFLLSSTTSLLPLMELKPPAVTAAKVVVFIPPPVPPGDAPINIRKARKKIVATFKPAILVVLKPAVLAVIDWKKLDKILIEIGLPAIDSGLLNSRRKNMTAPISIKQAVEIITTFA